MGRRAEAGGWEERHRQDLCDRPEGGHKEWQQGQAGKELKEEEHVVVSPGPGDQLHDMKGRGRRSRQVWASGFPHYAVRGRSLENWGALSRRA